MSKACLQVESSAAAQRLVAIFMPAVLLPFWNSLLVQACAWLALLQKSGLLNDFAIYFGLWETPVMLVHNITGTLTGMALIMMTAHRFRVSRHL